jgi:hypothetical protein
MSCPHAVLPSTPGKRMKKGQPSSPWALLRSSIGPLFKEFWVSRRALIIPALAYLGGLAVWSANATQNDLGPQAAASLQYLVAGLIPAALILLGVALSLFWIATPRWTSNWIAIHQPRWARWVVRLAYVGLPASIVMPWIGIGVEELTGHLLSLWFLLYLPLAVTLASFLVVVCLVPPKSFLTSILPLFYGLAGIAALIAVTIGFYLNRAYPWLPQSVGGGRARCAQLDIDTTRVSKETLNSLVPRRRNATTARTQTVDIIFTRDDVLFIKRRHPFPESTPTVELPRDTVRAVIACD